MTINVYALRDIPFGHVLDDMPEFTYENVTDLRISKAWLQFYENGEKVEIRLDHTNYQYRIS